MNVGDIFDIIRSLRLWNLFERKNHWILLILINLNIKRELSFMSEQFETKSGQAKKSNSQDRWHQLKPFKRL
jgi:hypothetical protein